MLLSALPCKENNPNYIELILPLLRTGGVISIDNIFAGGGVIDPEEQGESITVVRQMNQDLLKDDRFDLSLVPIGDGMTYLRKR